MRPVSFDPFCRDGSTRALRGALEEGWRVQVLEAFRAGGPVQREFLVHTLASGPTLPTAATWPEHQPSEPVAWLLRASVLCYGDTPQLEAAEQDLRQAIELEDDGVGYSLSVRSGAGLGLDAAALRARYDRSGQASAQLPFATDHMLHALLRDAAPTGDTGPVFAFARGVCADVGPGDPRHRVIAMAHAEQARLLRADPEAYQEHHRSPQVQAELLGAAQASVFDPAFGRSPQHWLTLNWFAYVFCLFDRLDAARPLLAAIDVNPSTAPWTTHLTDPPGALADARARAGLPPLHPV